MTKTTTKREAPMEAAIERIQNTLLSVDGAHPHYYNGNIPVEVIVYEIFTRLPAKFLIATCSLVCKSWYLHIKNPKFFATYRNVNLPKSKKLCFLSLRDNSLTVVAGKRLRQRAKFEAPYNPDSTNLIGSCNGLLLFESKEWGIFWYNPLFRTLKVVDTVPSSAIGDIVYGFGYNQVINDYSLVKLSFDLEDRVEIYSISEDSWHRLQENPARKIMNNCTNGSAARYFNGSVHWLIKNWANSLFESSILSFDFNEEVFTETLLPRELQTSNFCSSDIFEVRGCLALVIDNGDFYKGRQYNVWVMSEFGVAESWTQKFVISTIPTDKWVCCTKDGTFLLYTSGAFHGTKPRMEIYDWEKILVKHVVDYPNSDLGNFIDFFWN